MDAGRLSRKSGVRYFVCHTFWSDTRDVPYYQESTGKTYLFLGDEIMNRRGLAWAGYPESMGSYSNRYDPSTGTGGIPLANRGYIQIIDFTDPENTQMVARYEVPEFGTHNIWVEDDKLYQAYYEGGLRVVDVSGELMGNLYTQGREISVFKPVSQTGYTQNATMVWGHSLTRATSFSVIPIRDCGVSNSYPNKDLSHSLKGCSTRLRRGSN